MTEAREARCFLAPEATRQLPYEALRADFVDQLPAKEVARQCGYTAGAFRHLCYQFCHDPRKQQSFFQAVHPGPRTAPVRDRVRDPIVAMRKRNLSVDDIQRAWADAGQTIRITALAVLLREEGFAP